MSNYKYTFNKIDLNSVAVQDSYNIVDDSLIDVFEVNSSFNRASDFIELHYYSLDGRWLKEFPYYTNFSSNQDSETANLGTLNTVKLNLESDLLVGGYEAGEVYLSYNFLSDLFTESSDKVKFFIEEISPDRTELRLLTTELEDDKVVEGVDRLKVELEKPDNADFVLNFGRNNLLIAVNIDTLDYKGTKSVVVKLYNKLPDNVNIKDTLSLNLKKANSVAFLSNSELIPEQVKSQYLKGPNFNLNQDTSTSNPTEYLNNNQAFGYPVTNSYYEVKSLFEEKGAELSVDYTSYSSFINFSSAKERLENFKYKFDLITTYQSASKARSNSTNYLTAYSGSQEYYENLINSILSNFDHYDRYLYYETGSYSWPKSGASKPYSLLTGSATGSWYTSQFLSASDYDAENPNQLIDTVPGYLKEDPNNAKYGTFIHMIGQHFDNLWMYAKGVTEKYDADNRLGLGVSKDLIEDALKNFGVKLYSSNRSTQELFKMFTGTSYSTGSESYVDEVISGSNINISEENYRKQVYKRLYHNLPLLLKSKGTERGLRALISTFGIPSFYSSGSHSGLDIIQVGGTISGSFNFGEYQYVSSSLDKIRIDNTGSIVDTTLSQFTSINKRDKKYSNDLNLTEVGYSPANYINNIIISASKANSFDINTVLGDPRLAFSSSYESLQSTAESYLSSISSKYDLKDFTRLLKYYDNVLFKTIKDFIPARTNISTGVIVKPHLLERSKAKQTEVSFTQHYYTGSIELVTVTGSHGYSFGAGDTYLTSYTSSLLTSGGYADKSYTQYDTAKFDGEFSGSKITLSTGELNDENVFKYDEPSSISFTYNFVNADADCLIVFGEHSSPIAATPTPTSTNTPTPTPTPSSNCSFSLEVQTITE